MLYWVTFKTIPWHLSDYYQTQFVVIYRHLRELTLTTWCMSGIFVSAWLRVSSESIKVQVSTELMIYVLSFSKCICWYWTICWQICFTYMTIVGGEVYNKTINQCRVQRYCCHFVLGYQKLLLHRCNSTSSHIAVTGLRWMQSAGNDCVRLSTMINVFNLFKIIFNFIANQLCFFITKM